MSFAVPKSLLKNTCKLIEKNQLQRPSARGQDWLSSAFREISELKRWVTIVKTHDLRRRRLANALLSHCPRKSHCRQRCRWAISRQQPHIVLLHNGTFVCRRARRSAALLSILGKWHKTISKINSRRQKQCTQIPIFNPYCVGGGPLCLHEGNYSGIWCCGVPRILQL